MEAVRPGPAGSRDRVLDAIGWARKSHVTRHGPGPITECRERACLEAVAVLGLGNDTSAWTGCLHAAVVIHRGHRVWYPCRSHDGDVHHFAAHWPVCPAPWCRLPFEHYLAGTMHDIPPGRVEYHDAIGVIDRG